ncbi:MAG: hypothetical protein RL518_1591 [Pseudomonadota bacterium]
MRRHTISLLTISIVGVGILGFTGCQGNTDGGEAANPDYREDVFIGDETSTGSIRLEVNDSHIPVGETSGFKVSVTDSRGQPIANTRVVCDSEKGVALIEPTSGYELTSSSGVMSGVVGCAAPGSYQMVCRLSIGANRRQFVSVVCTGDVPSGFTGFPGAGGGGLGGGSQTGDDGDIQITDAGFDDDGEVASTTVPVDASIDIVQEADCDVSTPAVDVEPFYDTYAVLNVVNNLSEQVTLVSLECSVKGIDGTSNTASCGQIGLTRSSSSTLEANNDSTIVQVPVFKAYNGRKYVGNPTNGTGTQITSPGLFTVSFKLYYQRASDSESDSEDLPYITATATGSFSNFNRCPAG